MSRYNPPIRRVSPAQAAAHKALTRARDVAQFRKARDQLLFMRELGEKSSVELEPHIDQDEFFDDQFERRSHEIQQTPGSGDAISVIPSKNGPWSGNNQLGIERHFAPDSNNLQSILKLPEWGFPEMWTLALGLVFDHNAWSPAPGASASFDVTALIDFGIGGVIQHVEVDWVNGAAIALPMNALNVVAQYNLNVATEAAGASDPPDDLRLRASICHGTLFQTKPTRTLRTTSIATIDLPPFARTLQLVPITGNEVDIFNFYSQAGTVQFNTGTSITPGLTLGVYTFGQFTERLSVAENTVGRPVDVCVPTGARSVILDGSIAIGDVLAQFGIGV